MSKGLSVWAPYRVAIGGVWDLELLASIFRQHQPCTANLALDRGVRVTIWPFAAGRVRITLRDGTTGEWDAQEVPMAGPFGLIGAVVMWHQGEGLHLCVDSDLPAGTGLGGSGAVAVATVWAVRRWLGERPRRGSVALLAQRIESTCGLAHCGLQDHLAAAFGGVHRWRWQFALNQPPYQREALLPASRLRELAEHLLVANTGQTRASHTANDDPLAQLLAGGRRGGWLRINQNTHAFAAAIADGDWSTAAACLTQETNLRRALTPTVYTPMMQEMLSVAPALGCGAMVSGAGRGGCLWAMGPPDRLARLGAAWQEMAEPQQGTVMRPAVARTGAVASWVRSSAPTAGALAVEAHGF